MALTLNGSSLRFLQKFARIHMKNLITDDTGVEKILPIYVLRKDGDSDRYSAVKGKVVRDRVSGHYTLGQDIVSLPCIII